MLRGFSFFFTYLAVAGVGVFSTEGGKGEREERTKEKRPAGEKGVAASATPRQWADWVEGDFPFFSSVLDCRDIGEGFPRDNLTPRGLILNLGHNLWACFDLDLLRIACIWESPGGGVPPLTQNALAPGSYHVAGQKTKDGQDDLPKPIGKVWLANGIYPGWQLGEKPSFVDPREPGESKEEVGRGPPSGLHFDSIAREDGLVLHYRVHDAEITEEIRASAGETISVQRVFTVSTKDRPLILVDGIARDDPSQRMSGKQNPAGPPSDTSVDTLEGIVDAGGHRIRCLRVPANQRSVSFVTSLSLPGARETHPATQAQSASSFSPSITSRAELEHAKAPAYALDDIPLPVPNPWKRNVRLADLDFLDDQGNAAGVTFDGDVWLIGGLKGHLAKVTWKRFASGLHEPMSIVARPREHPTSDAERSTLSVDLLVFDRNGIWKLVDTNGDGECDRYEMFCNLFAQTAETREFPNSMKLGPRGELYISKGGQEGTTRGKHNGTVIKIAPDGKSFEVIGYGLRQPFIGVHPKTGLVTASDQQGHYVPSTPLHIIGDHHFYGHLPTVAPKEKYPETITEPLTWIPHPVNPSGVTQVWLTGARMGPLNDELIHIGYNRPELFRVALRGSEASAPSGGPGRYSSAAVMSFWRDFDFPPLNAKVNPADGQLYIAGFQVWGTTAKRISGLARLRYTGGERVFLKELVPAKEGVLLRFNAKLDPRLATDPASYSAERWNYKRTPEYGSPHLKLDGSPGQEWIVPSSAYLSADGCSVLLGIPDMKAGVHQMRIGWGLKSADGLKAENTAYFSPWALEALELAKHGFPSDLKVDLTPRKAASVAAAKPTVEEGQRLYQMIGCMACHSTDGTTVGKVGPSWKGIFGSERDIGKMAGENVKKALKVKADESYLRESITHPNAKVVKGFEKFDTGMPIYAGILNESQIESLVLYIKSLK